MASEASKSATKSDATGPMLKGVYDRVIVFDSGENPPLMTYRMDFKDIHGRNLEEIFGFPPDTKLLNKNRKFRKDIETNDGKLQVAIFCRIEENVTPRRLSYELADLNGFFKRAKTLEAKQHVYNYLVDMYFEKMVMHLDYPPKNTRTDKFHWKPYDKVSLRSRQTDIFVTEDEELSLSAMVHRLMPISISSAAAATLAAAATSAAATASRSQPLIGLNPVIATSTPATSRETTPMPGTSKSAGTAFKPPAKTKDQRTTRQSASQHVATRDRERIERESREPSEAPSEIVAGNLDRNSEAVTEIKQMLTDLMNLLYDETRRAVKDEHGEAFDVIRADIEGLKKDIAKLDTKLAAVYTVTQKSTKDKNDFAAEIGRIMDGQAKIEKKLHQLGYTMAEKEAMSVRIISRIFPIDCLNAAVDVFLSNTYVQEMILKYLKPSIDGIDYHKLDKGISEAILTKMFTQNCRAHLIVGETNAGLANKMWCKRPLPNFCINVIDSLVLPYLSKKLKSDARDHIIQKNVSEVTSRMQVTLCGDRTAFVKRAAAACRTGEEAIRALYDEDCRFYDDNRHVIGDEKPSYEEYFKEAKKLVPIRKLFELEEERGPVNPSKKKKVYPQPGHVFDNLKARQGQPLKTVQDAVELIVTATSTLGKDMPKLYFDHMQAIPNLQEQVDDALANVKDSMANVVEKWLQSTLTTPAKRVQETQDSEDEFQVISSEPGSKKKRGPAPTSSKGIKKARAEGMSLQPTQNPNESGTPSTSGNTSSANGSTEKSSENASSDQPSPPLTRGKSVAMEKKGKKRPADKEEASGKKQKRRLFLMESESEEENVNKDEQEANDAIAHAKKRAELIQKKKSNESIGGAELMQETPMVQQNEQPPEINPPGDHEEMHDTEDEGNESDDNHEPTNEEQQEKE